MVELAKQYQADAVVFSSLTDYHPYWPPRVGVKLHIVSTHEAVTLASIDGLWDAKNEPVALAAENFYCQLSPKSTLIRPDTILYAPSYFQKFVAHQIVGALAPPVLTLVTDSVAPTSVELPSEVPPAPSFEFPPAPSSEAPPAPSSEVPPAPSNEVPPAPSSEVPPAPSEIEQ